MIYCELKKTMVIKFNSKTEITIPILNVQKCFKHIGLSKMPLKAICRSCTSIKSTNSKNAELTFCQSQ